jgi:hypothetical protein
MKNENQLNDETIFENYRWILNELIIFIGIYIGALYGISTKIGRFGIAIGALIGRELTIKFFNFKDEIYNFMN